MLNIRVMYVAHTKDLSVGHLNIYHVTNKVNNANVFLSQSNFLHIFGVSETRLTSHVSDDMLGISKNSILRRDANATGPTGMAVYVHGTIRDFTSRRFDLEYLHVESVWLHINNGRGPLCLIVSSTEPFFQFCLFC